MANINKIRISGTSYDIQDSNATKVVDITQAEYDALPASAKTANILYNITDAEAVDFSQYWTSAETQSAITEATSGKVSTSDFNTYSGSVDTALNSKASQTDLSTLSGTVTNHTASTAIHVTAQDKTNWNNKSDFSGSYNDLTNKLSAGTGIDITDNVISATGGGSITVDSALDSGSTNPVENQALWDELRLGGAGLVETTIEWSGNDSTNYPSGSTEIKLEFTSTGSTNIEFRNENSGMLGVVSVTYQPQWGMVSVDTSNFQGATYEISGSTFTISYPSVTNVTKLYGSIHDYATVKAIYNDPLIVLKDQVTANTAAIESKVDTTTFNSYASSVDSALGGKLNISDYVVDSALNVASTNPVQNQALYSELRIDDGSGETETTLVFDGHSTTNYPNGCTKIKVEDITSMSQNTITFFADDWSGLGYINVSNWGSISVDTSSFQGASYEISGSTVIISYPTVTTVTRLDVPYSTRYTYKAITNSTTPLKDQVVANTASIAANTAALATKQTTLTAGTGIDITSNVISVTGGTGGGISSAECQTMINQSVSGKTNQSDFTGHTASTVHMTTTEKTNLDSLATNIAAISGITSTKVGNWDTASTNSHIHSNKTVLDGINSTKVSNWDGAATNASNAVTALGGLKLVKLTQSAYDALLVKDNDTLYIING